MFCLEKHVGTVRLNSEISVSGLQKVETLFQFHFTLESSSRYNSNDGLFVYLCDITALLLFLFSIVLFVLLLLLESLLKVLNPVSFCSINIIIIVFFSSFVLLLASSVCFCKLPDPANRFCSSSLGEITAKMRMMSCRSPSCRRRILVLFLLLLPNLGQASVESHPVDLSMQSYLDLLLSSPDSLPSPPEVPFRSSAQFIFDHHLPSSPLSSSLSSSSASFDASMKFDRTRTRKRKSRLPASLSQAINRGLRLAVQECKHQFQSAQWNCPTMKHLKGKAMFGQLLNQRKQHLH